MNSEKKENIQQSKKKTTKNDFQRALKTFQC